MARPCACERTASRRAHERGRRTEQPPRRRDAVECERRAARVMPRALAARCSREPPPPAPGRTFFLRTCRRGRCAERARVNRCPRYERLSERDTSFGAAHATSNLRVRARRIEPACARRIVRTVAQQIERARVRHVRDESNLCVRDESNLRARRIEPARPEPWIKQRACRFFDEVA